MISKLIHIVQMNNRQCTQTLKHSQYLQLVLEKEFLKLTWGHVHAIDTNKILSLKILIPSRNQISIEKFLFAPSSHQSLLKITQRLNTDSEVTVDNCQQHMYGDYVVLPTVSNCDYTITVQVTDRIGVLLCLSFHEMTVSFAFGE